MMDPTVRRSGRISKAIPILLIGSDSDGIVFSEEAKTVVISEHGAGVISSHKLVPEQELIVRSIESQQEAEIRVIGEIGTKGNLHTYGVSFLRAYPEFWGLSFAPNSPYAYQPVVLTLECSTCRTTISLEHSDFEFDICAVHGGLVRYCGHCGLSTIWRQPIPGSKPQIDLVTPKTARLLSAFPGAAIDDTLPPRDSGVPAPATEFAPPPSARRTAPANPGMNAAEPRAQASLAPPASVAAPKAAPARPSRATGTIEDRRDRVRAKVNFFACVRSEAYGDEVVTCIDMSRGGLGFKSKNSYAEATQVRIAVPFSPENKDVPTIFVPARIAHVRPMAGSSLQRCGVEFIRGDSWRKAG